MVGADDDSIGFGRFVSVVPITEDGLIGEAFDPIAEYPGFNSYTEPLALPDGTSVALRYADVSTALFPSNSGVLMQHVDAEGMNLGEESDLSGRLGSGTTLGARVDAAGNIALLQASRGNRLAEVTFSPDGRLLSRELLYERQDNSENPAFSDNNAEVASPDGDILLGFPGAESTSLPRPRPSRLASGRCRRRWRTCAKRLASRKGRTGWCPTDGATRRPRRWLSWCRYPRHPSRHRAQDPRDGSEICLGRGSEKGVEAGSAEAGTKQRQTGKVRNKLRNFARVAGSDRGGTQE